MSDSSETLTSVRQALKSGDKKGAREQLRPLLAACPSAELWVLAAQACDRREKAIECLHRALALDPTYDRARRGLEKLEAGGLDLPPLDMLLAVPVPPIEAVPEPEATPFKWKQDQKRRNPWTLIGCAGSILLSLSSTYFVLTMLGSPLAGQIRAIISGEGLAQSGEGTPVFGRQPEAETPASEPETAPNLLGAAPTDGTPVFGEPLSRTGSNTFEVHPSKSVELSRQQPVSDVLDSGQAHEYTFTVVSGEELAVGVQFFSPTAKQVGANAAVLDAAGYNAENYCQRDQILSDGSSVAFICQVNQGGTWKLHLFGRTGESTGVYVVTFDRLGE
ncbi:MAG TPA: hypothetical protein VHO69_02685 [Phototrophicaceae bacterium]|nr:hypothetical protein [Phototrophicaceae bacterium]